MDNYEYQSLLQVSSVLKELIRSASTKLNNATEEHIKNPSIYTEYNKSLCEANLRQYQGELYDILLKLDQA